MLRTPVHAGEPCFFTTLPAVYTAAILSPIRRLCRLPILPGGHDKIAPFPISGAKAVISLRHGGLISCPGFPHRIPIAKAATNADLPAFRKPQSINSLLHSSGQ
ncbi:hypothetical protein [Spirosoma agri]|uniref:Uncharacterized protein n=1 Tax=Spirosoma agri TaxID=1987381 RepID=A0A6M0IHZ2_9BACT|nr:hypothetical protein [Spirosoma agri]NEU67890.1 hypothetical protein [Spirosoma agri]